MDDNSLQCDAVSISLKCCFVNDMKVKVETIGYSNVAYKVSLKIWKIIKKKDKSFVKSNIKIVPSLPLTFLFISCILRPIYEH